MLLRINAKHVSKLKEGAKSFGFKTDDKGVSGYLNALLDNPRVLNRKEIDDLICLVAAQRMNPEARSEIVRRISKLC